MIVSCVSWFHEGDIHIRVYTVDGGTVSEQIWEGGWKPGAFAASGKAVAATSWWRDGRPHIRVYVAEASGKITEHCWDDAWYVGAFSAEGQDVSVTSWSDGEHIRVYVINGDTITEHCWDGRWAIGIYAQRLGPNLTFPILG